MDFKVAWRRRVYVAPIPSTHKIALLALAEYADWTSHRGAHPGKKRLTTDTGLAEKTIQRALAAGVELKLLVLVTTAHHTARGKGVANSYDLRLPESQADNPIPPAESQADNPIPMTRGDEARRTELTSQVDKIVEPGGHLGVRLNTPTTTPSIDKAYKSGVSALDTQDEARPDAAKSPESSAPVPSSAPGISPKGVTSLRVSAPPVSKASRGQATPTMCPLGCGTQLPAAAAASEQWAWQHMRTRHPDLLARGPRGAR
jgi:hypothetical protein